jgi:hypothetical protein
MSSPQTSKLDGWLRSLEELVATPAEYRGDRVGRLEALQVLRCQESVLDELIRRGLDYQEHDGEQDFERADLYNLALRSGSNRSLPELLSVFVRRMDREGPARWTQPRHWDLRVELRCPRGSRCAGGPWAMGRPIPEALGGSTPTWWRSGGSELHDGTFVAPAGAQALAVEAAFTTCGEVRAVRAAVIRDAFMTIVNDYRYQVLSKTWKEDLDSVRCAQVVDCVAAAAILADACREAGRDARVESGFLLGMFGFAGHRWVRVRDDDGVWKVLEPTLPLLSAVMPGEKSGDGTDAFARFCCGSTLNRVVLCHTVESGEIAEHSCGGQPQRPDLAIRARRLDAEEESEPPR